VPCLNDEEEPDRSLSGIAFPGGVPGDPGTGEGGNGLKGAIHSAQWAGIPDPRQGRGSELTDPQEKAVRRIGIRPVNKAGGIAATGNRIINHLPDLQVGRRLHQIGHARVRAPRTQQVSTRRMTMDRSDNERVGWIGPDELDPHH